MFFNSVKEINRLRKEIYRLLSKRMSNTYFKVAIEKKWGNQILDFPSLKISFPDQFLRSSNSRKLWVAFLLFLFWKKSWGFNPLMPGGNKKVTDTQINLQLKTESNMENPTRSFIEMNHVLHSAHIRVVN